MKEFTRRKGEITKRQKADKIFSLFIRYSHRDDDGLVKCYTCPKRLLPKQMQCGHFASRTYLGTRYDEQNCKPQCYGCNVLQKGQASIFAANLVEEYGSNILAEIEERRKKIIIDFPYELVIEKYMEELSKIAPHMLESK